MPRRSSTRRRRSVSFSNVSAAALKTVLAVNGRSVARMTGLVGSRTNRSGLSILAERRRVAGRGTSQASSAALQARDSRDVRHLAGVGRGHNLERASAASGRHVMSVLVAYASRHGATQGIAERIADRLRQDGVTAEALPANQVQDLAPYDACVVGSAAYMFHWLADANRFVQRNRHELAARPLWLFSSGPLGDGPGRRQGAGPARRRRAQGVRRAEGDAPSARGAGLLRCASTGTPRPSASPSASPDTCPPRRRTPCRTVTSATGPPSTPGPTASPRTRAAPRAQLGPRSDPPWRLTLVTAAGRAYSGSSSPARTLRRRASSVSISCGSRRSRS